MKADLEARRALFVAYLADRAKVEDWHGVMDAAADLREIDAVLKALPVSPLVVAGPSLSGLLNRLCSHDWVPTPPGSTQLACENCGARHPQQA